MCRQHAQVRWWAITVALLVAITWGTSGCGPRPPQVEIVVSPSISTLEVGERLALAADATGERLKYQWKFAGPGELLEPTTDPAVVYVATEPGDVVVTVEVTDKNDQMTTESYSFVVELPSTGVVERPTDTPTPTPTPAATPTHTPTPEPTEEPTSEPTEEPTPTATPMPDAVVVAPVNLRSGPGTAYDIVSTLSPDQVLTVKGRNDDASWLQVNTDQMQEGWVVNRADLVKLNLPTEQIPIGLTLPTPTPSLPPTETPTPTPMFFQNFEPDNGTPPGGGNYFWDAWFTTCSFESTIVREGSRAVRVDTHAEAEGNPGDHGGTMGINPSSGDPIDLSSATTLSVWVYDTQGNNTVQLRLRDNNDALSNEVWSKMNTVQDTWTRITWTLADFIGIDRSQIKNIELYESWDGVYYFDAVSWEFIPALESIPCSSYQADTDAETVIRLIQAESKAVNNEDISIIQAIFAEDALIRDAVSGEAWNDPTTRYVTLFENATYTDAIHFEIQPAGPGITEAAAWFTSGSRGYYVTRDGESGSYDNPPSSDHWTFGRNNLGCWVITGFTFNASHIPFP